MGQDRPGFFKSAMAEDRLGFQQASRALFADHRAGFNQATRHAPARDVRAYCNKACFDARSLIGSDSG